jgi:uncharacterized protein YchJ
MSMDSRRLEKRFDRKREKQAQIKAGLPTEDEPHPCGSGKKFKKCCGK